MITNSVQLRALRESRDHWFRMKVYWQSINETPCARACACCQLADDECGGCPINEYTGQASCAETPYYEASCMFRQGITRVKWEAAAQAEIDFIDKVIAWVEAGKPPTRMNKLAEQKQAITESREHWQRMYDDWACGERPVSSHCACCQKWYSALCRGCPISEVTGRAQCVGTPYSEAAWYYFSQRDNKNNRQRISRWRVLAQRELDFLIRVEAHVDKKIQKAEARVRRRCKKLLPQQH